MDNMKNILIVDDEALILLCLERCLRDEGYNVMAASNGMEAVEVLGRANVDLMITDLNMPLMDGFELVNHVSESNPSMPVVVMSGNLDAEVSRKLFGLGARYCLDKPFEMKELCRRVSALLGRGFGSKKDMGAVASCA